VRRVVVTVYRAILTPKSAAHERFFGWRVLEVTPRARGPREPPPRADKRQSRVCQERIGEAYGFWRRNGDEEFMRIARGILLRELCAAQGLRRVPPNRH
jgi:hypothetical protein